VSGTPVAQTRHVIDVAVTPPYQVHVARHALADASALVAAALGPITRVAILSDDVVTPLHGATAAAGLAALDCPVTVHTLPAGEHGKTLAGYGAALHALASAGLDRGSLVVALGGGVVGDVAGFAAATYMRGVPYVQVPTTLLAMVDSSVGGKTGVNLGQRKNLVGAFWQPVAVVADLVTLETLPPSERRRGAVELFKAGLLGDADLVAAFTSSPRFGAAVDDGGPRLADLVARGVRVKADVVARDPEERGVRATLNLGHTVGHALEALSHHALAHGEAVAYGLLAAAEIGAARGLADWRDAARSLLRWVSPGPLPEVDLAPLLAAVARDKKQVGGRRRFVLLETIGRPVIVDDVTDGELARAWAALEEASR
jgi:3-dehydroquinate synthase